VDFCMSPLTPASAPDTLAAIVAYKWQHLPQWLAKQPLKSLEAHCADAPPRSSLVELWQAQPRTRRLLLELKPASPSQGALQAELAQDPQALAARVQAYQRVASGLSVLTDEAFFGGSFELLAQVRALTTEAMPLLAKDIVVHPWQVAKAKLAGANACLLIVRALPKAMLHELFAYATHQRLTPIVEVHTEDELAVAVELNPPIILINNRNLSTLQLEMATVERLAPHCPQGCVVIAASGYSQPAELAEAWQHAGVCLLGTHLMRQELPQAEAWLAEVAPLLG
jgi:indole-3-glycerol phosphate synthase/phosphoribosylanthranilate isomerase